MVELSTVIMAVPERAGLVARLLMQLGGNVLACVSMDSEHAGPVPALMAALDLVLQHSTATHVLILEDDIVPCFDFLDGVAEVCKNRPMLPVSYCRLGGRSTLVQDGPYRCERGWWGTQAFSLPRDVAEYVHENMSHPKAAEMVGWWAKRDSRYSPGHHDRWMRAGDVWLRWALEMRSRPMWHTVPSLVQHGAPETSYAGSRVDPINVRNRIALDFIGEDVSALSVDWR